MAHACAHSAVSDPQAHSASPPKTRKAIPAATELQERPCTEPHPQLQSASSALQSAPPTPAEPSTASQPHSQPHRSHNAIATPSATDHPPAAADHGLHPYSLRDG